MAARSVATGTRPVPEAFDATEHRLAAILAADVVGFSRMMGADEAGTLAALDRTRRLVVDPAVSAHRGRIFKVMGDGLLMEFPSSMLAVRAAVAIQGALPAHNVATAPGLPVVLRIGIHQGDVVVHGDDLLGNGVNIAARLEGLAPPGGICVSARVREDAVGKHALPFEDGGERLLKNIARPVHVFFLHPEGTRAPPARDGSGEATLFNPARSRDHSLRMVKSASPGLASGQVVVLTGTPLVVGRLPPSGLLLPGNEVSRQHCRLALANGAVTLTDLRSTNGTYVDDHRIEGPTPLASGALIGVGPYLLRYVASTAADSPEATYVLLR